MTHRERWLGPLLAVVAVGCGHPQTMAIVVAPDRTVLNVPPDQMRSVVAEDFQLSPDRRFLIAAAEIPHVLTGRTSGSVSATLDSTGWRIRYGAEEVGVLPRLPSFHDADRLLSAWASRWLGRHPLEARPVRQRRAVDSATAMLADFFAPRTAQGLASGITRPAPSSCRWLPGAWST